MQKIKKWQKKKTKFEYFLFHFLKIDEVCGEDGGENIFEPL
jgi:hypothetical protein